MTLSIVGIIVRKEHLYPAQLHQPHDSANKLEKARLGPSP